MTSPKGWDTAEAARLHEYAHPRRRLGELHDLGCKPWNGCTCTPIPVYEREYNEEDGKRDSATPTESHILRVAPAVPAISGVAGALRSTGDRR